MNGSSRPRLLEQARDQPTGDAGAAALRRDGDVHQVPDLVVAGADEVAEQLVARRSPRGRSRRAWRAPARTSPATRASGRSAARSRSRRADRCRRAAAPRRSRVASLGCFGSVSLTPPLRVGGSQVDRGERAGAPPPSRPPRGRRCAARRPGARDRRRPANLDAALAKLLAKSYRPRSGRQRGLAPAHRPARPDSAGEPTSGSQSRSPVAAVERREYLAAAGIEDGEAFRPPARVGVRSARPSASSVQTPAAPAGRELTPRPRAVAIADPQAGERAGPEADRDRSTTRQPPAAATAVARPPRAGRSRGRGLPSSERPSSDS